MKKPRLKGKSFGPLKNAQPGFNCMFIFHLSPFSSFWFFPAVITILYMSEVFFEKVFLTRPFKALFVTSDDSVHEWWFRWQLDRYRWASKKSDERAVVEHWTFPRVQSTTNHLLYPTVFWLGWCLLTGCKSLKTSNSSTIRVIKRWRFFLVEDGR